MPSYSYPLRKDNSDELRDRGPGSVSISITQPTQRQKQKHITQRPQSHKPLRLPSLNLKIA
ncbi:hypothetical protein SNOG_09206 [Parastagonospora nodorum SN15]|uniref:Uncharacterized protein n=1 Tax=Phaeosphaeria nodorum (strain SN15 / ATCC MYA-4574 / FGSC 10173) TaxID=321614 RepID=Q0UGA8_PHANO|nr:hypothetical protein SNOG_09206 [Parastagonospora nodorum SN15]EAT83398.1 hypothetical protein SNOG_09206 [Parastagonospora nodorum SN15]